MTDNHRKSKSRGRMPRLITSLPLITLLFCLAIWPGICLAHGVHLNCLPGQAMVLQAYYDGGDPMSFTKIKLTGPDGKTYQVGNTDAKGFFAFVPDKPGQWTLVANDGMGHRAELAVEAATDGQAAKQAAQSSDQGVPAWARAAWGLSAFMFLFGIFSWLAARRKTGRG